MRNIRIPSQLCKRLLSNSCDELGRMSLRHRVIQVPFDDLQTNLTISMIQIGRAFVFFSSRKSLSNIFCSWINNNNKPHWLHPCVYFIRKERKSANIISGFQPSRVTLLLSKLIFDFRSWIREIRATRDSTDTNRSVLVWFDQSKPAGPGLVRRVKKHAFYPDVNKCPLCPSPCGSCVIIIITNRHSFSCTSPHVTATGCRTSRILHT